MFYWKYNKRLGLTNVSVCVCDKLSAVTAVFTQCGGGVCSGRAFAHLGVGDLAGGGGDGSEYASAGGGAA